MRFFILFIFLFSVFVDVEKVLRIMMSLILLLLLLLRTVVATESPIDGWIFKHVLENLASKSLGVQEIQVCITYFFLVFIFVARKIPEFIVFLFVFDLETPVDMW